jgi:hypothetical protein
LVVRIVKHPEFDISNSSLPMLLIWRFKRHDNTL